MRPKELFLVILPAFYVIIRRLCRKEETSMGFPLFVSISYMGISGNCIAIEVCYVIM
jgi:hypothetical protein